MPAKTILDEAAAIIAGPRRSSYGDVQESFGRIAKVWSVLLPCEVSASDVARCMLALKLCRECNKPQRDNRVDICGYAALLDQLESTGA